MKLVVIESPYARRNGRSVEDHLLYARSCLRDSLDRNEAPIASHLLYTQPRVLDDSIPKERQRGIQAGYEWMMQADLVVFYVDLGWSRGMLDALKIAHTTLHLPIEVRALISHTDTTLPSLTEAL